MELTSFINLNPSLFVPPPTEKYDVEEIIAPDKLFTHSAVSENENLSFTEKVIFKRDNPIYEDIKNKIYHLSFPNRWEKEGIAKPNIHSKEETVKLCRYLFDEYDLIPFRIIATKEGGLAVLYEDFGNNRSLIVEIYNDLDIAALVNDNKNKSIILSVDIRCLNFSEIIKAYCG